MGLLPRTVIVESPHGAQYLLPPRRAHLSIGFRVFIGALPVLLFGAGSWLSMLGWPERVGSGGPLVVFGAVALVGGVIALLAALYHLLERTEIRLDERRLTAISWIGPLRWSIGAPLALVDSVYIDQTAENGAALEASLWTGDTLRLASKTPLEILEKLERDLDRRLEQAQARIVDLTGAAIEETPWSLSIRTRRRPLGAHGRVVVTGLVVAAGGMFSLAGWLGFSVSVPELTGIVFATVAALAVIGASCASVAALIALERFEVDMTEATLAWRWRVGPITRRWTMPLGRIVTFEVRHSGRRRFSVGGGDGLFVRATGAEVHELVSLQAPLLLKRLAVLLDAKRQQLLGAPVTVPVSAPAVIGTCQVCGDGMSAGVVFCEKCRTPHHGECWAYNLGCSVYGCGGRMFTDVRGARPAPDEGDRVAALAARLANEWGGSVERDPGPRRGVVVVIDRGGTAGRLFVWRGRRGVAAEFLGVPPASMTSDSLADAIRGTDVAGRLTIDGVHLRPARRLENESGVREFLTACLGIVKASTG